MLRTWQICALFAAAAALLAPSCGVPLQPADAAENGLSSSHEAARTLWNNAKRLHRRLNRPQKRDTSGLQANYGDHFDSLSTVLNETAALNITVPKYTLELYSQLSNPYRIANTQANTIRTQEITTRGSVCGEFNFSIASINSSEFILKAELHLYLENPSESGDYVVFVKLFNSLARRDIATSRQILTTKGESGWFTFDVDEVVHEWVQAGEPYAVFKLQVYPYDERLQLSPPLACEDDLVPFVFTRDNTDTEPFLVVYSYDDEVEQINYGLIMDQLERDAQDQPTIASPSVSTSTDIDTNQALARRKRDATPVELPLPPTCSVQQLNVTAADLNRLSVIRGSQVFLPLSYNAGVCGGKCGSKFPRGPQHAALIHILLNQGTFNDRHGYSFSQCCAPVRYTSLETLTRSGYEFRINILTDMKIMQCECLDVIDYS